MDNFRESKGQRWPTTSTFLPPFYALHWSLPPKINPSLSLFLVFNITYFSFYRPLHRAQFFWLTRYSINFLPNPSWTWWTELCICSTLCLSVLKRTMYCQYHKGTMGTRKVVYFYMLNDVLEKVFVNKWNFFGSSDDPTIRSIIMLVF